jgi:hypothetical protein
MLFVAVVGKIVFGFLVALVVLGVLIGLAVGRGKS